MSKPRIVSAPNVDIDNLDTTTVYPDRTATSITHNVPYDALYKAPLGPENPSKASHRNQLTGTTEQFIMKDHDFERERTSFETLGYAVDPVNPNSHVGSMEKAEAYAKANILDELPGSVPAISNRKRKTFGTVSDDPESYVGPWAGFEGETYGEKKGYSEQEMEQIQMMRDRFASQRQKKLTDEDAEPGYEKSVSHVKDDYMTVPEEAKRNSNNTESSQPKKSIATLTGHTKGVSQVRFFPQSGHLLLSCGLDGKVKLWSVYNKNCVRSFMGHGKAVKDVSFSHDGKQFFSASYDKYVKQWDTETGKCIGAYFIDDMSYCVKTFPQPSKSHLVLAGYSRKIAQWDCRTGRVAMEFDQHLGSVNSIDFINNASRFVSVSDDKTIRIWESDLPTVTKLINEPKMHAMPCVVNHPSDEYFLVQCLNNCIQGYSSGERFKLSKKKRFVGHLVAGYALQCCTSPDGNFVASGDADGKLCLWHWDSAKLLGKLKGHDKALMGVAWHPYDPSKLATCSWDGTIKIWN